MKRIVSVFCFTIFCIIFASAQSSKSVSILGDSYSTYEGYLTPDTNFIWYYTIPDMKRTDVSSVTETWWYKYIKENGCRLCVNNSFSGATICNTGYRKEDYSDRSFINRFNNLGCPDVIFIFGATNDSWAKSPIGEYKYEKWTKQDLYSFRPAMAYLLDKMKERYVNTQLYFILNDGLSADITSSCKEICKYYNIKCIELNGIDKKNGHPTVKGMSQIDEQVKAALGKK